MTDPLGGTTRLSHDDRDNVISVTIARDVVIRRYEYDRKDRLTKEIWPDGWFYRTPMTTTQESPNAFDAKGLKAATTTTRPAFRLISSTSP